MTKLEKLIKEHIERIKKFRDRRDFKNSDILVKQLNSIGIQVQIYKNHISWMFGGKPISEDKNTISRFLHSDKEFRILVEELYNYYKDTDKYINKYNNKFKNFNFNFLGWDFFSSNGNWYVYNGTFLKGTMIDKYGIRTFYHSSLKNELFKMGVLKFEN